MFLKSIVEGAIILFTHWEFWLCILIYEIILLSFRIPEKLSSLNENFRGTKYAFFLIYKFLYLFLWINLLICMIFFILPIPFGKSVFDLWIHSFKPLWMIYIPIMLYSTSLFYVLTLIPFIQKTISAKKSSPILIQGIIIIYFFGEKYLLNGSEGLNSNVFIYPGFFILIGFLILSLIIELVLIIAIFFILVNLKIIDEYSIHTNEPIVANISSFIGISSGILGLCIYSSYINHTILSVTH